MAIERDDIDERRARIDGMVAEFRAAQQRRLVKQGIVLWKRAEMEQHLAALATPVPTRIH
jgi:hypothetical protein